MDPLVVKALIALLPVIGCLAVFQLVDAFKLIGIGEIALLLAGGAGLAAASYFANGGVMDTFPIGLGDYTRYVAPAVEETIKGLLVVGLFAFNRVGYLIDAAIAGFAIGAGFSLTENLFYLHQFQGADIGVWMVRGFGTAIMHGGATAMLAALSQMLFAPRLRLPADRFRFNPLLFLPGLAAAILVHAAFNHFPEAALTAMAVAAVIVPVGLFAIFALGETYAHRWLAADTEAHSRLLEDMRSGAFAGTDAGRAIQTLAARLDAGAARDLTDYVRTNAELVVRAEATLLALEQHQHVALGPTVREQFAALHGLERRLGRTLVMAVRQHLRFSRDDLWKMHELEGDSHRGGIG
ncbi:MAG TPA: PrsW family glutamic-type intramembrane protease [Caulobacteraceae bacterium]|nr:PrsW family glutamic-type intramembrane protease [Caulobacteraceae bacterium]